MTILVTVSPLYAFGTLFNVDGKPLAGGKLFAYEAGSSSILADTYTRNSGSNVLNPNPIVLDSSGRLPTSLWLDPNVEYHLVLTKPDGTTVLEQQDYVVPAASQAYVDQAIGGLSGDFLPLTGGAVTGSLSVSGTTTLSTTTTGSLTTGNIAASNVTATTFTGGLNANSVRVINVDTPTAPTDAATKGYVDGLAGTSIPPGAIMYWTTSTAPTGWLKANGASLSRATYPALFAAIGTTYGTVDGSSFNVPDLRGYFVRGLDEGRGVDTGRALGTNQTNTLAAHKHVSAWGEATGDPGFGTTTTGGRLGSNSTDNDNYWYFTNNGLDYDGMSNAGLVGSETRPVNIALVGIIKT